jgi:hypothetical protein
VTIGDPICHARHDHHRRRLGIDDWDENGATSISQPEGLREGVVVRSSHVPTRIASVDDPGWLDQQRVNFTIGDRAVLHTARHDEQLAGIKADVALAELDGQCADDDDEQLVGVLMCVPDELALDLDDHDFVVIEPRDDFGRPVLGKQGQLLGKIHRFVSHAVTITRTRSPRDSPRHRAPSWIGVRRPIRVRAADAYDGVFRSHQVAHRFTAGTLTT